MLNVSAIVVTLFVCQFACKCIFVLLVLILQPRPRAQAKSSSSKDGCSNSTEYYSKFKVQCKMALENLWVSVNKMETEAGTERLAGNS